MATNTTGIVWHVQIAAPLTDPAIDRAHTDYGAAADRYLRFRTSAALAALPLVTGVALRRFGLTQITQAVAARLGDVRGYGERVQLAFRAGCHVVEDPTAGTLRARLQKINGVPFAEEGWLETLAALPGIKGQTFAELGGVVLRRAEIGDLDDLDDPDAEGGALDPLDLYGLPPGTARAR